VTRPSRRRADRDEPVPLRDALAAVGDELGLPTANTFGDVEIVWRELAGADVAQHSRLRSLRDGECTIEVDGPAWATRARYLTGDLKHLANTRCGEGVVTVVKVVVSPPRSAG
jgi:predicted nucleic acid-binding Zn ribbon protein